MSYGTIHVRELATGKSVKSFECSIHPKTSTYERMLMGLLRNMDTDRYVIDDDAVKAPKPAKKARTR